MTFTAGNIRSLRPLLASALAIPAQARPFARAAVHSSTTAAIAMTGAGVAF